MKLSKRVFVSARGPSTAPRSRAADEARAVEGGTGGQRAIGFEKLVGREQTLDHDAQALLLLLPDRRRHARLAEHAGAFVGAEHRQRSAPFGRDVVLVGDLADAARR